MARAPSPSEPGLRASPYIVGGGNIDGGRSGAKVYLDDCTVHRFVTTVAGSSITSLADTTNWIQTSVFANDGSVVVAARSTLNLNASVQNAGTISLSRFASAVAQLLVFGNGTQLLDAGKVVLRNSTNYLIGSAASVATSGAQLV